MKRPSVFIIFLTVFIDLIGFGIVLPLLPIYSKTFGANGWQIGVLMASYSVMQFLFSPVWGRLSDRIGRRPVLLVSTACSMTSTSASSSTKSTRSGRRCIHALLCREGACVGRWCALRSIPTHRALRQPLVTQAIAANLRECRKLFIQRGA